MSAFTHFAYYFDHASLNFGCKKEELLSPSLSFNLNLNYEKI